MPSPIRLFEGRFGRVVLADASAPGEPQALAEPLILLKHDGADVMFSIASTPQPLTREGALFANPNQPTQFLGNASGAPARVIAFHPSAAWLQAAFPAAFEEAGGGMFPRSHETITPRIRQLADTLAIEALNDQFLSPERLEFMLQELMLSIVETYVARRQAGGRLWRGSPFADTRIDRKSTRLNSSH